MTGNCALGSVRLFTLCTAISQTQFYQPRRIVAQIAPVNGRGGGEWTLTVTILGSPLAVALLVKLAQSCDDPAEDAYRGASHVLDVVYQFRKA